MGSLGDRSKMNRLDHKQGEDSIHVGRVEHSLKEDSDEITIGGGSNPVQTPTMMIVHQDRLDEEVTEKSLKNYFIDQCKSFLLTSPVTDDSMISNEEYTDFLVDFCIKQGVCSPDYTTTFESLDMFLELEFLWAECDRSTLPESVNTKCMDDFMASAAEEGGDFGFIMTDDNSDEIETKIEDLCINVWPHSKQFHGGTKAPTFGPSNVPSLVPSPVPPSLITKPSSTSSEEDPISNRDISSTRNLDSVAIATISAAGVILMLCFAVAFSRSRRDDRDKDNAIGSRAISNEDEYETLEGQPLSRQLSDDSDDELTNVLAESDSDGDGDDPGDIDATVNSGTDVDAYAPLVDLMSTDSEDPEAKSINVSETTSIDGPGIQSVNESEIISIDDSETRSIDDPDKKSTDSPENYDSIMKRLDLALDDGDWGAVASIAGDISLHDDSSSAHSRSVHSGSTSKKSSENEDITTDERIDRINKLIAEGDWLAVGSTAAAYEEEQSDAESMQDKESEPKDEKRSTLLDFLTWSRPSSRQSKKNQDDEDQEQSQESESNHSLGDLEDTEGDDKQRSIRIRASRVLYEADNSIKKNSQLNADTNHADNNNDEEEKIIPEVSALSDGSNSSGSLDLLAEVRKKSTDEMSLDNDLDKAIEQGDWSAFEDHANAMMDAMNKGLEDSDYDPSDYDTDSAYSDAKQSIASNSTGINDERIASLEKLIENDDWQGIVTPIHNEGESTTVDYASQGDENGRSAGTVSSGNSSLMKGPEEILDDSSKDDYLSTTDIESETLKSTDAR